MKKILLILVMVMLVPSLALALPGEKKTWQLCWNPNTESDLDHYDVYWRAAGATAWTAANSREVGLTVGCCLVVTGLVPTNNEMCVTASDTSGNESGASVIVPFAKDQVSPGVPGGPILKEK